MDHSKKSTRSISCFWIVTLAQGMVFIDLFCRTPLNWLVKNNPIAILLFLRFSYSGLNEAGFMCVSRTVMRDGL